MKSMFWALCALGAVVFGASGASAACPPTSLQNAANLFVAAGQASGAAIQEINTQNGALIKSCSTNPHVLKVAAMTYQSLASRTADPSLAYDFAVAGWTTFQNMRDARAPNEAPQMILVNNQYTQVDVYALDATQSQMLETLFIMELRTGKTVPDHAPFTGATTSRTCGMWDPIDATNAALFIQRNIKTDVPPARNFIDRMIASCAGGADKFQATSLIGSRAKVNYLLLTENPKRPGASKLLDQAIADSKKVFELQPAGNSSYWSKYDRDLLAGLTEQIRPSPQTPEADWFKPGNPEKPETVKAIAKKLDAAWAIDVPLGVAAAYKNYRDVIKDVYARATSSGNVGPAKHAIALAAKGHSDGTFRAPANKALKSPPDFLWTWIDPTVNPTVAAGAKD